MCWFGEQNDGQTACFLPTKVALITGLFRPVCLRADLGVPGVEQGVDFEEALQICDRLSGGHHARLGIWLLVRVDNGQPRTFAGRLE